MMEITPEKIANSISSLLSKNKLWENKDLYIYFIANPKAGCFTNSKNYKRYNQVFNQLDKDITNLPVLAKSVDCKIFKTQYPEHATELTESVISQFIGLNIPNSECVIITGGGDGTSLEVECALFNAAQKEEHKRNAIMNNITLLRLPLGTGNDGTDGHSIEETIQMLKNPLQFKNIRAINIFSENPPTEQQILSSGKNPVKYNSGKKTSRWNAFNITSIGLDAYVVYLTNTIKKKFPGNIYQLCVPISGLIYDKDFPTGNADVEFFDENGQMINRISAPITLLAFGESGHRVYGGGHKILPDDNNVCMVPKVTLKTLIKENHRFEDGSFIGTDLALLNTANKIRISYDKPILLECDGEVTMLCKDHFPLVMEKTEPCIRIVCPISSNMQA